MICDHTDKLEQGHCDKYNYPETEVKLPLISLICEIKAKIIKVESGMMLARVWKKMKRQGVGAESQGKGHQREQSFR